MEDGGRKGLDPRALVHDQVVEGLAAPDPIGKAAELRAFLDVQQFQLLQAPYLFRDGHEVLALADAELLQVGAPSEAVGDLLESVVLHQMEFEELLAIQLVEQVAHVGEGQVEGELGAVADLGQGIQQLAGDDVEQPEFLAQLEALRDPADAVALVDHQLLEVQALLD